MPAVSDEAVEDRRWWKSVMAQGEGFAEAVYQVERRLILEAKIEETLVRRRLKYLETKATPAELRDVAERIIAELVAGDNHRRRHHA